MISCKPPTVIVKDVKHISHKRGTDRAQHNINIRLNQKGLLRRMDDEKIIYAQMTFITIITTNLEHKKLYPTVRQR